MNFECIHSARWQIVEFFRGLFVIDVQWLTLAMFPIYLFWGGCACTWNLPLHYPYTNGFFGWWWSSTLIPTSPSEAVMEIKLVRSIWLLPRSKLQIIFLADVYNNSFLVKCSTVPVLYVLSMCFLATSGGGKCKQLYTWWYLVLYLQLGELDIFIIDERGETIFNLILRLHKNVHTTRAYWLT